MTSPRERAVVRFRERFGREPALLVRAPGRVNLLGAHVDYNDGYVLPVAIDRAVWLAAAPARGRTVRVAALDLDEFAAFSLDELAPGTSEGWPAYPQGVAWALGEAGLAVPGMDATLSSDVPIGAGLSSSAAVEVAFALAWVTLGELLVARERLAELCQRAENAYVGVACGIMDQMASLLGRADHAMLLDCRTLEIEQVPFPEEIAIVISDTGVRRRLSDGSLNARRAECKEAVRRLRPHLPGIAALRDVTPEELTTLAHRLPPTIRRRARHVVTEIARVRDGAKALRAGELEAFGAALIASHVSSRRDYESSIYELNVLAEAAWAVEGCYGARLSGAGFGGCTLSLVDREAVGRFKTQVGEAFAETIGRAPTIYVCQTAGGAEVAELSQRGVRK